MALGTSCSKIFYCQVLLHIDVQNTIGLSNTRVYDQKPRPQIESAKSSMKIKRFHWNDNRTKLFLLAQVFFFLFSNKKQAKDSNPCYE